MLLIMNRGDILVESRYGDKNYLCAINENEYSFKKSEFIRVGFNEDNSINFIDPPGGPFMQIDNFSINGKLLKSIRFENDIGFILTF